MQPLSFTGIPVSYSTNYGTVHPSDMESRFYGRSVVVPDGRIIHEAFIDTELFNIGADRTKIVHQFFAFLVVIMHVRTFHDESGTFAESADDRFGSLDPVFLSGDRLGENDAVPLFFIAETA